MVPVSLSGLIPRSVATSSYSRSRIAAGALIVIEVDTESSGRPSSRVCMSSMESIATPTLPTSPLACGASESKPICVGRSKATDKPVVPAAMSCLYLRLESAAVEKPAYCRIVHGLVTYMVGYTPLVNGYSPGSPSSCSASKSASALGPYTGSMGSPDSDIAAMTQGYGRRNTRQPPLCPTTGVPSRSRGQRQQRSNAVVPEPGPTTATVQRGSPHYR